MGEKSGELKQLFAYERDASRLELFVRIVYWIAIYIVVYIYSIIACICLVIQWLVILVLGRRSEGLALFIKGYLEYLVHVAGYVYFTTDERPNVIPKKTEVYEKK